MMTQNKETVRIPIFNGFVEISKAKYDELVKCKRLDDFKSMYEPKTYTPTFSYQAALSYDCYTTLNE